MIRRSSIAAALAAVALGACAEAPAPAAPELGSAVEPRSITLPSQWPRYIITFKDGVTNVPGFARQLSDANGGELSFVYQHAMRGFAVRLPSAAVAVLSRHPLIERIEPDLVVTASALTQTGATWGLDRTDQASLPLSGTYSYDADGSGVRAYIVDTGILPGHVDFGGRVISGFSAINDGRGTADCNGHGTHVAGTVGGTQWGVAKKVTLVPVRVLDCAGSGTTAGVIAGIDWITANAVKPAVANMSLGGGASSTLDNAVARSVAAGVTYVVAAGNSNANACNYSPARAASAITVGATTSTDVRASYSNFGSCLDLFAPGSSIKSAWYTGTTATNTISGTSMASPHVAGVAALYLQQNPTASVSTVTSAIVTNATASKVTSAGTGSPNRLLFSGFIGGGGGTPANQAPTASFTVSCTNLVCSFNGTGSTDADGTITSYSWNFGDGTTATGATASRTYATAGTRTVTLTVTDNGGATGSAQRSVTVSAANQAPTASFTVSCTNLVCLFNGTGSTDADGTIASYSWNFGDGTTATGATASRTYATAGTRTVTLTVTDNGGATGSAQRSVTVTAPPAGIVLVVTMSKSSTGRNIADLSWTGAASRVDIFRNTRRFTTVTATSYRHDLGRTGGTSTYQVCNAGTRTCSNSVTVTY